MTASRASTPASTPSGSIVLLGRHCDNTAILQETLQDAGLHLSAVILADPEAPPANDLATRDRFPVYRAPSPSSTRGFLEHLRPDLVIAACYPWRLSQRARSVARHGVLNIHPSPLPHGRGPAPVFWLYRNGERDTGVTIHLMDDGLDSGQILSQERMAVPETMDAVTLEHLLFEIGATMTAEVVPRVLAGNAASSPQDDLTATYQPAPTVHDWIISPLLPASWAWRFVRGVAPLRGPLSVQTGGQLVPVRGTHSWSEDGVPPDDVPAGTIAIQFRPGWVVFER